jgi:hypothetical protein
LPVALGAVITATMRAMPRHAVGRPGYVAAGWAVPAGYGLGEKAAHTLFIIYSFSPISFSIFKIPGISINF